LLGLRQLRVMPINGATKDGNHHAAGKGGTSLSLRGSKALTPFSPYIQAVNDAKADQWSPTNPDGYFLMATAESVLSFDLIHEKIRNCREVPATVGLYGNFRGGERLRNAIARMMQRTFMGVEVNMFIQLVEEKRTCCS
jgi:hypothetical protein